MADDLERKVDGCDGDSCGCGSLGNYSSGAITQWVLSGFEETFYEGTFDDFLRKLDANPRKYLRSSFQYLFDAVRAFGVDEKEMEDTGEIIPVYNIFDDPFTDGDKALFGLERKLHEIVSEIESTAKMGQPRIILLNGPVATAKTTIIDLISKGLEVYSRTDPGELLRFQWQIGDETIPCLLNENPIMLLPVEIREKYLKDRLSRSDFNKLSKKILKGDLCPNCRGIFDSLLKEYKGDWNKVLGHVQVERYTMVENRGIVRILQASEERGFLGPGAKSPELQKRKINFYNFFGPWAAANRGLIHYVDIFKQRQAMEHLSSAVEEGKVSFGFISTDIDTVIFMTSNLEDYQSMRNRKFSRSLRDRIQRIDVPYILRMKEESKIYSNHLRDSHPSKHVAPYTVEVVSLWAVLTRLTLPSIKKDRRALAMLDEVQRNLIAKMTPMQKVQIYNGLIGTELTAFPAEACSKVNSTFRKIVREANSQVMGYAWDEGMFGISPRQIQNIFKSILKTQGCLSPVDVIHRLESILEYESEDFEYLEIEKQVRNKVKGNLDKKDLRGFNHSGAALKLVKGYLHEKIRDQVGFALVGMTEDQVATMIRDYILSIRTVYAVGQYDEKAIDKAQKNLKRIEDLFEVDISSVDSFRIQMHQIYMDHVQKHPGVPIEDVDMKKVMRYLFLGIMKKQFDLHREDLDWPEIRRGFARYGTDSFDDLETRTQEKVKDVIGFLKNNCGYCELCAQNTFLYADDKGLFQIDSDFRIEEERIISDLQEELDLGGLKS